MSVKVKKEAGEFKGYIKECLFNIMLKEAYSYKKNMKYRYILHITF